MSSPKGASGLRSFLNGCKTISSKKYVSQSCFVSNKIARTGHKGWAHPSLGRPPRCTTKNAAGRAAGRAGSGAADFQHFSDTRYARSIANRTASQDATLASLSHSPTNPRGPAAAPGIVLGMSRSPADRWNSSRTGAGRRDFSGWRISTRNTFPHGFKRWERSRLSRRA